MKKKFKKLSVLVSAVLCASCLGMTAAAEDETANMPDNYVYDGIYYDIDGESAYVYDAEYYITSAEIMDTYKGYPVTMITSYAFSSCKNLKDIVIPDSVNYIDEGDRKSVV